MELEVHRRHPNNTKASAEDAVKCWSHRVGVEPSDRRDIGLVLPFRRATSDIVLIEDSLGNGIGRSVEPSVSFRLGVAEHAPQTRRVFVNLDLVDPNGDDRARADVGAAPLPSAAPKQAPDLEFRTFHDGKILGLGLRGKLAV
jgi:hypothetical protein